jgi:hypothetical protein
MSKVAYTETHKAKGKRRSWLYYVPRIRDNKTIKSGGLIMNKARYLDLNSHVPPKQCSLFRHPLVHSNDDIYSHKVSKPETEQKLAVCIKRAGNLPPFFSSSDPQAKPTAHLPPPLPLDTFNKLTGKPPIPQHTLPPSQLLTMCTELDWRWSSCGHFTQTTDPYPFSRTSRTPGRDCPEYWFRLRHRQGFCLACAARRRWSWLCGLV